MNILMILKKMIRKIISLTLSIPYRILELRLKWIYNKQFTKLPQARTVTEQADPEIIKLGLEMRTDAIQKNANKYKDKPYRFLFHMPKDGVGVVWFKDLIRTLEHTGIKCASVQAADPAFRKTWESFQPNVFISIDVPYMLKNLDLDYIQQYKKAHGCFRFFTPFPKHKFPAPGISSEDQWRLELARSGKSADAFFSMFVSEFFSMFLPEWVDAGFSYLELPHGCNPLYQYPREGEKEYDYFMATSFGPERVKMTWDYMKPIFEQYRGAWAGPGWSFGLGILDNEKLPEYYARTKIVPNPMGAFLINYPMEISERAFSSLACGAFQIADWTPITEKFFSPDELIQVRGREEFLEAFAYYVNHPKQRNEIVINGMKRLYAEHTYFHRIDSLIAYLDSHSAQF